MTAYTGKNLSLQWIHPGGTIALDTDYKSFDYTPTIDILDQSAGADTARTHVTALKDGTGSLSALMQAGGTALTNALSEGTFGTIILGPEGTASGKQKMTIPMISLGAKMKYPFEKLVELTCDFQQDGLRVDGVF